MSEHRATIRWAHWRGEFRNGTYSREHTWSFDGGITLPASPSPSSVPEPYSNPGSVDPEEAFVAAIASCHMLTFLYLAYREGLQVESYEDAAVGVMMKNERGIPWVSSVVLRPRVVYSRGTHASVDVERRLHEAAHAQCYVANSVKTDIVVKMDEG